MTDDGTVGHADLCVLQPGLWLVLDLLLGHVTSSLHSPDRASWWRAVEHLPNGVSLCFPHAPIACQDFLGRYFISQLPWPCFRTLRVCIVILALEIVINSTWHLFQTLMSLLLYIQITIIMWPRPQRCLYCVACMCGKNPLLFLVTFNTGRISSYLV